MRDKHPVEVFISYAHEDRELVEKLQKHLEPLIRTNSISTWDTDQIMVGQSRKSAIEEHLQKADLILLLISLGFLVSDDCRQIMKGALQRAETRQAHVVPILLMPCPWESLPLSKFQMLPRDGKPITNWHNEDEAFHDVVHELSLLVAFIQREEFRDEASYHIQPAQMAMNSPQMVSPVVPSKSPLLQEMVRPRAASANQISSRVRRGSAFIVTGLFLLFLAFRLGQLLDLFLLFLAILLGTLALVLIVAGVVVLLRFVSSIIPFLIAVFWDLSRPKVFIRIGHLCAFLHWYSTALRLYEQALRLNPQLSKAYRAQSKVYKQLAQRESSKLFRQAQHAYKKARQLNHLRDDSVDE